MARALVNIANGGIGDVRYSRLDEAAFQAQNGPGWVLYDGRDVTGSKLASVLGITALEDHRGLFPRAKNNGRSDGNQDPGGERVAGAFQDDSLQGHYHQFVSPHWSVSATNIDNTWVASTGNDVTTNNSNYYASTPISDGTNGTPRIASETRSKNIALNAYIKIN